MLDTLYNIVIFVIVPLVIIGSYFKLKNKYTQLKWIKTCGQGEQKIEWIDELMTLKVGDKCQKQFDISEINYVQYGFLWNKNYMAIFLHEEEESETNNENNWTHYSHRLKYECDDIAHFVEQLKALDIKFNNLPEYEILANRLKNKKSRIVVIKPPFIMC